MIPIAWKEIRENAKWAILGLLGVAIAMTYTLGAENSRYNFMGPEGVISAQFQMITIFGSSIVAALLGLLQIVPERLRDQWSYLLHRPATRSRLFWGKTIGGLVLYFAMMGLPLLAAACWASRPGHMPAPFDWRMVLPGVADILAGVTMYFAGLLVALRPARWYATRILPIFAAGLTMTFVVAASGFGYALLFIFIAWVLFGTIAWAAFIRSGDYLSQPRPAKFGLGIILLLGIFTTGGLLVGLLEAVYGSRPYRYSQYFIDNAGRVRIVQNSERQTVVTDLKGRPVDEFKDPTIAAQYYNHSIRTSPLFYDWNWYLNYRQSQQFCFRVYNTDQEAWYFVRKANRFEGFRIHDGQSLGWIGSNGHHINRDQTEPFPSSPFLAGWGNQSDSHLLVTCAQSVFRVDFTKRTINTIYTPPVGQSVLGACEVNLQSEERGSMLAAIAVALPNGIILLDPDVKPLANLPYHYDTSQYGQIQIGVVKPGDRFFLWYSPSWRLGSRVAKMPSYVVEISPLGQQRDRVKLPPLPQLQPPQRWYERVLPGLVPLVFYVVVGSVMLATKWYGNDEIWASLREQIERNPMDALFAIGILLLLIMLTTVMAFRVTHRYAFSPGGRRFWVLMSVFFGPAALFTLLGLHQWPALVPCPNCNKRRRVDHEHCPHCNEPFPTQEVRPGDIYDAESPQGSNEPAHPATLVPSV